MLANLRRKMGLSHPHQPPILPQSYHDPSQPQPQNPPQRANQQDMITSASAGQLPPMTIDNLGFTWPADLLFSPTNIPLWIQEVVRTPLARSLTCGFY